MRAHVPRSVVVTRETEYEALLARHATHDQAAFFLTTRGQSIDAVKSEHDGFHEVLQRANAAIPVQWRRTHVTRRDLDRFLFEPDDIVIVVGQDGLVPNVAKYLQGQPVIGVNPNPRRYDGVLVPYEVGILPELLPLTANQEVSFQSRTMVRTSLDDGQELIALNEVFVGVRTHQSARYELTYEDRKERHSSSGVIVATGTGSTGWARSICLQRRSHLSLPQPQDERLVFFVREAFPSVFTETDLTEGIVNQGARLEIRSENNEGGVIFGDGIEDDFLDFNWGCRASIEVAPVRLILVVEGL